MAGLPDPVTAARVRLWVDRSFTIRGSGTVVTGTLGEGTIAVGDELEVAAPGVGGQRVRVRGLQSLELPHESVAAVARVAVNLRGVGTAEVAGARPCSRRTPGGRRRWRMCGSAPTRASCLRTPCFHVGTAAHEVRVRPLGGDAARLVLSSPLPLRAGDRAILRDPGAQRVVSGVLVLDVDPPPLRRRGAGARRGAELAGATGPPTLPWRCAAAVR